jgi:O-antigen/teichoic acid export membrane protein
VDIPVRWRNERCTSILIEGRGHDWPAWAWMMLAVVPAVLALLVRQQARREAAGAAALVPTRLFARRGFAACLAFQLAFHLGWGSFALVFGLYVQHALGFTPLEMDSSRRCGSDRAGL